VDFLPFLSENDTSIVHLLLSPILTEKTIAHVAVD